MFLVCCFWLPASVILIDFCCIALFNCNNSTEQFENYNKLVYSPSPSGEGLGVRFSTFFFRFDFMNLSLEGKYAVICGSTQGIGLAIAEELALLGANCTLMARNEDALKTAVHSLDIALRQQH